MWRSPLGGRACGWVAAIPSEPKGSGCPDPSWRSPPCDRYVTGRMTDGMVASHARPSRISAGKRLSDAGISDFVILEATDRIGGRTHKTNFAGRRRRGDGGKLGGGCNEEPAGMPPCMIRSRRCTRAMCIVEKGDDEEIQQLMVVRGIINNSSKIFRVVKFCCKAIRVLNRAFGMYFVVIDDMSAERWCDIGPAFPVDDGISIRIVVTTNIQSIDNACSTADGYVYKMGKLNTEYSKDLFFQSASVEDCSPDMERGSEQLRKKFHGLPQAPICIGHFLHDVCNNLGHHLENKDNNVLAKTQRTLTMNYTYLCGDAAKACLLYLGMFPGNHPIRRKRLLRACQETASPLVQWQCSQELQMFMDWDIVQPINVRNNEGVRYHAQEYKLLQVLDLEECDGFMDGYLDSICKLLLLKYVSIGGAVTTLPKTIAGLKLLETLDFRRNKVEVVIISVEVLVLPKLIHLFGKFELPGSVSNKMQKKIEPGKSNLQILAGFIAANNHGFVKLMCHMKNLRKVNIWCKSVTKGNKLNSLSIAIEKFIENSNDPTDARTLSVDFSECSEDILQISI
uniref:Uncharacterized protein n=1 Tax=Oryza glumipatula TaxID=40148 RepID=A0A0E0B9K0_9ORYZ